MGNTITEPVMPNDITQHRAVGGGVRVRRHMYLKFSLCTTLLVLDQVQNQNKNTEREDDDTSHNSNVEQNLGNCKAQVEHTQTRESDVGE